MVQVQDDSKQIMARKINKMPEPVQIKISAVGDIMVHNTQYYAAFVGGKEQYDFRPVFTPVKKYIESSDFAVANLETTLAGKEKQYSNYPRFNSPEQIADALKYAGFDMVTTANNHCLDRGAYGVVKTIENLNESGLLHTGTARNREERDKVLLQDIKGIKIAFLSYTYGTNGINLPGAQGYMVNRIDRQEITGDINKALSQKADVLIACLHFGNEYARYPGDGQKELVDYLFARGVDMVLGSHPHVLQPMEIKEINQKKHFVIYSMGNFVSDQRDRYRDSGIIVDIVLEKNVATGEAKIKEISYTPTWVDKSYVNGKLDYRILPVRDALEDYESGKDDLLSKEDYLKLKRTLEDVTVHMGNIG